MTNLQIFGEKRKALLEIIEEGIQEGLSQQKVCETLDISERRVQRWREESDTGKYDRKKRVLNQKPFNALIPYENSIVEKMIASAEHADDSCRVLSIKA